MRAPALGGRAGRRSRGHARRGLRSGRSARTTKRSPSGPATWSSVPPASPDPLVQGPIRPRPVLDAVVMAVGRRGRRVADLDVDRFSLVFHPHVSGHARGVFMHVRQRLADQSVDRSADRTVEPGQVVTDPTQLDRGSGLAGGQHQRVDVGPGSGVGVVACLLVRACTAGIGVQDAQHLSQFIQCLPGCCSY